MAALEPLLGGVSSQQMRAANGRVDLDRDSVKDAAAWLKVEITGEIDPE